VGRTRVLIGASVLALCLIGARIFFLRQRKSDETPVGRFVQERPCHPGLGGELEADRDFFLYGLVAPGAARNLLSPAGKPLGPWS
jgi:hypothetical protein